MPDIGSSPLSQGTFVHILHLIVPLRLIPATAENTKRHRTHASSLRLIPARTGSIRVTRQTEAPTPAHPRSRGEHRIRHGRPCAPVGSSPLARGTYSRLTLRHLVLRLIPARAGNMAAVRAPAWSLSAHPRSRGEHPPDFWAHFTESGSSPLARGTSVAWARLKSGARLIPARAGNISQSLRTIKPAAAHPRSRGEHVGAFQASLRFVGSSPLARGTYIKSSSQVIEVRLIPARAGNIQP